MRNKVAAFFSAWLKRCKHRGIFVIALAAVVAAIVLVWAGAAQWIGHRYVLMGDGQTSTIVLYPGTVDEACRKAGMEGKLVRNQYESGRTTYLTLGDTLYAEITRGGSTITVPFSPCTVSELLAANDIILAEEETVSPELGAFLSGDAEIAIVSVDYKTITETEEIAYGILVRESDELEKGVRKLVRSGQKGEKQITYRVALHDGEEVERTILSETVVSEPVDCVYDRGTGVVVEEEREEMAWDEGVIFPGDRDEDSSSASSGNDSSLSTIGSGLSTAGKEKVWSAPADVSVDTASKRITTPDGETHSYSRVLTVKATAYHRLEEGGLITATGTTTQYGTIAVDPSVIPLGSRVFVVAEDGTSWSYGPGLAEDTGGLIKGNRIDLFFMTGSEANNFGVRMAKIYILTD